MAGVLTISFDYHLLMVDLIPFLELCKCHWVYLLRSFRLNLFEGEVNRTHYNLNYHVITAMVPSLHSHHLVAASAAV